MIKNKYLKSLSTGALSGLLTIGAAHAVAQVAETKGKAAKPDYAAHDWSLPRVPVHEALDANGDGVVGTIEIQNAPSALKALDANNDALVDERELGGPGPMESWLRLQTAIKVIDANGDSQLSFAEIDKSVEALRRADLNRDWVLDNDELYYKHVRPKTVEGLANVDRVLSMFAREDVLDPILPGEDSRQYEGYMYYTESNTAGDTHLNHGSTLLDPNGNLVQRWPGPYAPEGVHSVLLENGLVLRTVGIGDYIDMEMSDMPIGSHGILQLVDWDGTVVWEFSHCIENSVCLHHDIEAIPNGNFLVTEYYAITKAELEAIGRTKRDNEWDLRWFERILEIKPNLDDGSTEIVWIWDSLDHMVQDQFPDRPNYGDIKENSDRFDINYPKNHQRHFHVNGIDYHPELQQIAVSSLSYNEVFIIDHSTTTEEAKTGKGGRYGKGGRILFRFGNPAAYGFEKREDIKFGYQHDPQYLFEGQPGKGNFTVHNNVAGTIPGAKATGAFMLGQAYSSIVELKLPIKSDGSYKLASKGDPYKKAKVAWEYIEKPLGTWHTPFAGGALRLPNGNTIVLNSQTKRVFEVTPEGERVLDFKLEGPGRPQKMFKFSKDYPGLSKLFE